MFFFFSFFLLLSHGRLPCCHLPWSLLGLYFILSACLSPLFGPLRRLPLCPARSQHITAETCWGWGGSGVHSPVAVPTQPLPFHGAQGDQKGAGCSQSRVSPELGLQAPRGPDSFSSPRGPCNMRFVCRPCCGCWHGALELDSGEGHGKKKKKKFPVIFQMALVKSW